MPPGKIENLVEEGSWEEMRKRIKTLNDRYRSWKLLKLCTGKETPDDIIEALLSKTEPGHGCDTDDDFRYMSSSIRRSTMGFHALCLQACASPLRLILKRYFQTSGKPICLSGNSPLRTIWSGFHAACWKMDDLLQVQSIHDLRKFSRGKQGASDLNNLWEKTVLLIRASQEDGMNKPLEEINILGTLIEKRMSNLCIWVALRLLPSSCLSHRDSQGRMPLHLAVLSHKQDYYWHNWSGLPACTRAVMDESTVFDMLISAYPDSATEPDSNGSLPLPLLLRECNRSFAGLTTKGKEFMMRSVRAVAKHAPQVLTLPNRDDNMLPFMLAARSSLDLTFAILIEHPSVLACGTKKATDREIWLTRKFSKAQTQIQKLEDENRQLRALLAQQKQQEPAPPLPPRVAPIKIYNLPSLQFPTPKRRNDMVAASDEDAQVCSDRPSKARRLEPGY